jgi:hypothetical protein
MEERKKEGREDGRRKEIWQMKTKVKKEKKKRRKNKENMVNEDKIEERKEAVREDGKERTKIPLSTENRYKCRAQGLHYRHMRSTFS